jgi:hypothetical protein
VYLLDVGSPEAPTWLDGASLVATRTNGNVLSFTSSTPGPFLAVGTTGLRAPVEVRAWSAAPATQEADLLIVAPAAWSSGAEALADLRRGEGLAVNVVTVEEIADAYGQGIATPQALRAAVAAAADGQLRYLVLAGDGSVDYRNLLGFDESKVPALFVSTAQGLFPADNRYGDLDDDGRPEIAVGRLPVRTAAELDDLVDKLAAYASFPDTGWMRRATLLADAPDGGADFSADSERAASRLGGHAEIERIYLADLPLAAARAQLAAAFHQGAGLMSYLGHAGLDRLSGAGLLTSADVAGFGNGPKLPVLTAMTCSVNRFAVAGVPALGELLVRHGAGGAAAVLAPSGTPYGSDSRAIGLELFGRPELFDSSPTRLGDWLLAGYAAAVGEVADPRVFDLYNLLGDPTMKLRLGSPTGGPGGGGPPSQE